MKLRVYLSPHLDDAVFSCGGTMHRQIRAGETVHVVTVFAGTPQRTDFSGLAEWNHEQWGLLRDPVAARRTEDITAVSSLGASHVHLDYLDCMYRAVPATGEWMYPNDEAIFGDVHSSETVAPPTLARTILGLLPLADCATLYAPIAAGHHVDHQLVRGAGIILVRSGLRVLFFEDVPHVEKEGSLDAALSMSPTGEWTPITIPLHESDMLARLTAISCYRSQLGVQFGGPAQVEAHIRAYASSFGTRTGYAERYWSPRGLAPRGPRGDGTC